MSTTYTAGLVALGVVLGTAVVVSVAAAVYYGWKKHRRSHYTNRISAMPRPVSDLAHPANSIVPFGIDIGQGPRFASDHTPGINMRVALQREDGSWQFTEADATPARATLSTSDLSLSSNVDLEAQWSKSAEAKRDEKDKEARYAHSRSVSASSSVVDVPPPSYSQIDASPLAVKQ